MAKLPQQTLKMKDQALDASLNFSLSSFNPQGFNL